MAVPLRGRKKSRVLPEKSKKARSPSEVDGLWYLWVIQHSLRRLWSQVAVLQRFFPIPFTAGESDNILQPRTHLFLGASNGTLSLSSNKPDAFIIAFPYKVIRLRPVNVSADDPLAWLGRWNLSSSSRLLRSLSSHVEYRCLPWILHRSASRLRDQYEITSVRRHGWICALFFGAVRLR